MSSSDLSSAQPPGQGAALNGAIERTAPDVTASANRSTPIRALHVLILGGRTNALGAVAEAAVAPGIAISSAEPSIDYPYFTG